MKVYRNNRFMVSHVSDLPLFYSGGKWTNQQGNKVAFTPQTNTIIYTGPEFEGITDNEHFDGIIEGNEMVISASTYYIYDGRVQHEGNVWIAVWKEATDAEVAKYEAIPIFNIMKGTYTGKDMGERSITAQIDFPSRIDFQIGDYVKFEIANLMRANGVAGGYGEEKFFIYTKPTIKKVARPQSHGKAFQHTVTFYPCQYELATVKMRDVLQEIASGVIYTGYDEFSFYGGANTLMKRIMAVLNERFPGTGVAGRDYWSYQIADSVNEDLNTALEKFQFDFSDSSVMDALLKLNDAEGINTKFFINERMIYVGYKRPYITGVDANNIQRSVPFEFMYGKTSHLPGSTNYGNLFTLTKASGSNSPITRLYAYGSDRNLHRFYCSDRIKTGRYVNKLMLPSFEDDGRTDYIDSPEGIAKFGIREGTKTFDNIYPSLRFFYYGNLRDVKYCIKLMGSGLESDADGVYDNGTTINKANITPEQIERVKAQVDRYNEGKVTEDTPCIITIDGKDYTITVAQADVLINSGTVKIKDTTREPYHYPIARVQCYKVVENPNPIVDSEGHVIKEKCGLNMLVESAPPTDLAVFCHATGKVVKVVLYADDGQPVSDEHEAIGMTRSEERQLEADGKIPTHTQDGTDYIVGSCFAVHDADFGCGHTHAGKSYDGLPDSDERAAWFIDADSISIYSDDAHKVIDKDKEIYRNEVSIHQIHYTDDHWITDVYEFTGYNQQTFNRQGYSAYCWPRVNKYYPDSQSDNIEVNAVVDVGPVMIEDTDLNMSQGQQQKTFDIYLRDVGFKINEQTWFGDKVFLFDTCHINFLDGKLAGYSFEMPAESDQAQLGSIYVPALKPDGSLNSEFFDLADNPQQAYDAYARGAFWRIVAKRQETEVDRYYVPNVMLNASRGDHVVFLDIFMPDIYVRVAEQRLHKEAKKYLDANDDGDIQYSFDIDKVRPNEQPIFAIQMREGAIMRVVDDDLDVGTVNKEAMLFDDKYGLVSLESMLRTETDVIINYEVINRTREDIIGTSIQGNRIVKDAGEWYLFFDTLTQDANKELYYEDGIDIYFDYAGGPIRFHIDREEIKTIEHTGSGATVALHKLRLHNVNFLGTHQHNWLDRDWHVEYSFKQQMITPQTNQSVLPVGVRRYCAANNLTEFKPSKYYEVLIDTLEPDLAVSENGVPCFALVNGLGDGQTIFTPEYTAEIKSEEGSQVMSVLYKFTLSDEFDDSKDYYPAILYQSDGETEAVHVRLWSILERDDEHLGELNYVDLAIDSVTINFNDNTREAGISLQDGQEPERLTTNQTEMVREVTATVKEESRASAWAQLAQRMDAAEILQDQTLDFYQNLVNQARQHYIQLLSLKNNIFDPDGTCKDTFLQVMMLQVGADSMNYQLKYTHYGMNGQTSNCGVYKGESEQTDPDSGKLYFDSFVIENAEEVMDHYVYTKDLAGGRWYPVERNVQFPLHKVQQEGQEQESYPTYFIALKASTTDSRDCHWVCEPVQHKVNELLNDDGTGYYYFNWGILVPDADGHYALTETRGNAYMYGDNLICGQISTLAGNSYFDLTHGNFVLSNGDESDAALSYINGVLTIKGFAKDSDITNILVQLGLVEDKADSAIITAEAAAAAASAAQQAANAAQAAVDNVTNDGIISKGSEKQELNREFIIIAGSNRDGEGTDGSYYKNITQADEYGLDHSDLDDAFEDLYAAMKVVLGTSQSTGKIDGSKIQQDTYIGGLKNGTATYDINQPYGENLYVGDNPLVLTNKYYTGIIPEYDKAYMLSIKRVEGNAYALAVIKKTGESTSEDIAVLISRQSENDPTVYTNIKRSITNVSEELGFRCGTSTGGQRFEVTGINIRPWTNIGIDEFNALWKNYYDAEVELLNRISNAIDEREIGGENLSILDGGKYEYEYTSESGGIMSGYIDLLQTGTTESGGTIFTYLPAGKYVFSAKEIYGMISDGDGIRVGSVTYTLEARKENDSSYSPHRSIQIANGDYVVIRLETEYPCTFRIKYAYGIGQDQTVSMRLVDVMLQRGTKPTSYQDYVKHLADALHGSTEIAGGLTMTNLLMLKDEGGNVQAGMSGLTKDNENVLLWGGATYLQALWASLHGYQLEENSPKLISTLLKKDGTGKIGCFRVVNENTVSIMSSDGTSEIVISAGENAEDTNITIFQGGVAKVIISGDKINRNAVSGVTVQGRYNSYSYITNKNQNFVITQINLSGGSGSWTVNFDADKIMFMFEIMPITTIVQVRCYIDIYMCGKLIASSTLWTSDSVSSETSFSQSVGGIMSIRKFYSANSAMQDVEIRLRNIEVRRGSEWSTNFNNMLRIAYLRFCKKTGSGDYTDASVYFSNVASDDIVQIGRNGIQVSHKNGGFVQMLNDGAELYMRMFGLPSQPPTGSDVSGRIYSSGGYLRIV